MGTVRRRNVNKLQYGCNVSQSVHRSMQEHMYQYTQKHTVKICKHGALSHPHSVIRE